MSLSVERTGPRLQRVLVRMPRVLERCRGRAGILLSVVLVAGLVGADRAVVAGSDHGGVVVASGFSDVVDGVHGPAMRALEAEGIFEGTECGEGLFCAGDPIRRWVMAVWMVRVLDGADPAGSGVSRFADVDAGTWWAPFVERLAELEVTAGCATGPLRFCPDEAVTRGQMATFLVRAFGLEGGEPAGFVDTDGSTHAASIDALAATGVTAGCATDPLRFCPAASVTRGQMATFLVRAQGTTPTGEPAPAGAATYEAVAGACGLLTDDTITCWANTFWTAIVSPRGTYKSLVTGGDYYCAIAADDTITCWGEDWSGETDPPAGTYKTISAGLLHGCAIATDDTITCWGDNRHGQADAPGGHLQECRHRRQSQLRDCYRRHHRLLGQRPEWESRPPRGRVHDCRGRKRPQLRDCYRRHDQMLGSSLRQRRL